MGFLSIISSAAQMKKQTKNSPSWIMASCWKILLIAFGSFRIRRFHGFLIFWMVCKLVENPLQLKQLITIQPANPLNDLLSVHMLFSFLLKRSGRCSRVANYITKEAPQ